MRALIHIAGLCLLTALAGCNNMVGTADPPVPLPEDPNPFTFKAVDYPYTVRFSPATDVAGPDELARLQQFLQESDARPGDKITISGETTPLGQQRLGRVRATLAKAGLEVTPGIDINPVPNAVGLVLKETIALPPKCGTWPVFAGDQPSNSPSPYLGCALKNNLYEMVADKRDLVMGRTPGPADAEPGMRAVQAYREGKSGDKDKGAAGGGDNSAAGSASNAASAAAGMADSGGGGASGGSSNGQ
jgi:type IV pilus biogenesis protein CpaD/CtpE